MGDGPDRGVFDFAIGGEGVEGNEAVVGAAEDVEAVALEGDGGGGGGEDDKAAAFGGHDFHEGGVLEFGGDAGLEVAVAQPGFGGAAEGGVFGGEEGGGAVEGLRKIDLEFGGEGFGGAEQAAGFAEAVVKDADVDRAGGGLVGEDDVEAVSGELGDEVLGFALAADELEGAAEGEDGPENFVADEFGEGVGEADAQAEGGLEGAVVEGVHHFAAEGEDFFGVALGHEAGFGEDVFAAFALEEALAEGGFEFADLAGDGGLGDAEVGGGAGEAALLGDDPEVAQVVVIQPIWRGSHDLGKSEVSLREWVLYETRRRGYGWGVARHGGGARRRGADLQYYNYD